MMIHSRFILLVTGLLCAVAATASVYKVSGVVRTEDKAPVPYARVAVEGSSIVTVTDKNGCYELSLPSPGEYTLKAAFTGYKADTRKLASGLNRLDFTLVEDMINLNSVVVTGTKTPKLLKDAPIVTRVITSEDIGQMDATNVRDVLEAELPGLEFTYSMNQQVTLNMSGFGGMSILFLVDGERMAGETLDNIDFSRLNMDNVERIEIVKGAASSLYGSNAVGAVINLITKKSTEPWAVNVNTRFGAHSEQRHGGAIGVAKGRFNNTTNIQYVQTDSYSLGEGDYNSVFGSHLWDFKEKLVYRPADRMTLTGKAGYFFRQRESVAVQKDRARDFNGSLRMDYDIDDTRHIEAAYVTDRYDKSDYYTITDKEFLDYKNMQHTLRVLYTQQLAGDVVLTAGAGGMSDYLMSYQFTDNGSHAQYTADAFGQIDWKIGRRWNLLAGVRADYFSLAGWNASPKVSAMYRPGRLTFRASYSGGFRAPTLKEMYMDFNMADIFNIYGNRDLKAERSHNFSLSGEYTRNRYNLTVTGYCNAVDNRITTVYDQARDEGRGAMVYTNTEHVNIAGVDASLTARYPVGIGAKLAYSYMHEFVGGGKPNTNDARPHSLTAQIDYGKTFRNYSFNVLLSGRYLSRVATYTIDSSSLYQDYVKVSSPAYSLWKLVLTQRFRQAFRLSVTVDNLFGYRPSYYAYNSPSTTGTTVAASLAVDIEQLFKH